jgi:hypothetical protein
VVGDALCGADLARAQRFDEVLDGKLSLRVHVFPPERLFGGQSLVSSECGVK